MSAQSLNPIPSRPTMPAGYGIPQSSEGMFAWDEIRGYLETAQLYWIATTRPDGRPHVVPIWGAWVDDHFYFEGSPETRRGRNLAANPAVAVHIEQGNLAIIVEGIAEETDLDPERFTRIADSFAARYNYRPENSAGMYVVRPQVAFAWSEFPTTATRWHFN